MTTSGLSLNTLAVALIWIVTGLGTAVEGDDAALGDRARRRPATVQLAGVPLPTTWSGADASASPAPGGIVAPPSGCPASVAAAVTRVIAQGALRGSRPSRPG